MPVPPYNSSPAPAIILTNGTDRPKVRARQSSLQPQRLEARHPLFRPIIRGVDEDPREWERHRVGMIDSLEPENHLEIVLVERVANLLWRIKRLERYETEMIIARLNRVPDVMASLAVAGKKLVGLSVERVITHEAVDAQVARRLTPDDETVTTIMRYEASLHRQCIQILHELEAMQTRRKGGASPLARLDFSGPPGG